MSQTLLNEFQSLVSKLQSERQAHAAAVAEIDAGFESLGITVTKPQKRRQRQVQKQKSGNAIRKTKSRRTSKRKKYRMTANEFVLATIKKAGAKGASGASISTAWKASGRPGDAYNTLGALTKAKRIKRSDASKGRGSIYRIG
jgi:hypothetical protein